MCFAGTSNSTCHCPPGLQDTHVCMCVHVCGWVGGCGVGGQMCTLAEAGTGGEAGGSRRWQGEPSSDNDEARGWGSAQLSVNLETL